MSFFKSALFSVLFAAAAIHPIFAQSVWTAQSSGTGAALHCVAVGANQWVAVGDSGVIVSSTDGMNWVAQTSGTTDRLMSVIWTGTQWMAVGSGGTLRTVLTSPDAVTWTTQVSGAFGSFNSVVWSGDQFLAVGQSVGPTVGGIATSPDGVNWTAQAQNLGGQTLYNLLSVIWTGSQFVAAGGMGSFIIATSPDGVTWTRPTFTLSPGILGSVAYNGSQYVAVANSGATTRSIVTSSDGAIWSTTAAILGPIRPLNSVVWTGAQNSPGQWVAVGGTGAVLTSVSGAIWSTQSSGFSGSLYSVASAPAGSPGSGLLVAVGTSGAILTSPLDPLPTVPATPVLVEPAPSDTGVDVSAPLGWDSAAGTVFYHVQLSRDPNFDTLVVNDSMLTTPSRSLTSLSYETVYYWRVRARNSAGNSDFSATSIFTTRALSLPSAPAPMLPIPNAVNVSLSPTLSWGSAGPQVTTYHLQVASDLAFTAMLVDDSLIVSTSRAIASLAYNTTYYWRVGARNSTGAGAYSEISSFLTLSLAPPSNLKYPVDSMGFSDLLYGPQTPMVTGTVTQWSVSPDFPASISLNGATGVINGYPATTFPWTAFTITAANSTGSTTTTVWIGSFGVSAVQPGFKLQSMRVGNNGRVVSFHLAQQAHVRIQLYDSRGQVVAKLVDQIQKPGDYRIPLQREKFRGTWGTYWLDFKADGFHKAIRLR